MGTMDRRPYLTATVLNQSFLDECQDNLTNQLELIVDIEAPNGETLHFSDRNKYVGETFYEARLLFPAITRTIGEYLNPTLEFSELTLEISNVDGALNYLLPSGSDYQSWVGLSVSIKLGLREVASTYREIFYGKLIEEGGFQRSTRSITLTYRNEFSFLNADFPKNVFKSTSFPWIEEEYENAVVPIIYGDWTTNVEPNGASIIAFPVNGNDPDVNGETSNTKNIEFVISEIALKYFDTSSLFIKKNDNFYSFNASDIVNVIDNKTFELLQSDSSPPSTSLIEGELYKYQKGDKFYCKVKGKDLGLYDDNIIAQSMDILISHAGADPLFFSADWAYFKDKASPAESAVKNIKSRIALAEPQPTLNFVLSLLEQLRLEAFINKNGLLGLISIPFDEFNVGSYTVTNWDIQKDSFSPKSSETLNFNRCKGVFNFLPSRGDNFQETLVYKNQASIDACKKDISKKIVFPNLYIQSDVENQIKEILKITSSFMEVINVSLTWRSLLQDIGNFVKLNVDIEGIEFDNVPCLIRELSYDPEGIKIMAVLWSFQMIPFLGWNPGYSGIVGGTSATITNE